MPVYELRPLSLGELLDRAFLLYRRNFMLFYGIMIIPSLLFLIPNFFLLKSNGVPWDLTARQSGLSAPAIVFGLAVFIVVSVEAHAAITFCVAAVYLGRAATIRESYAKSVRYFWRLLGVSLNIGLRVFGLIFLFAMGSAVAGGALGAAVGGGKFLPAIGIVLIVFMIAGFGLVFAFSMRYALSIPALLLEEIKGRTAIRRSVALTEGRRGRLFLAILLGIVVIYALLILFQGPFYALAAITGLKGHLPSWLALCLSFSAAFGGAIAAPLNMIVLVLSYYDARVRKEGFDLQHMMNSLEAASPVIAVADPATSGPVV